MGYYVPKNVSRHPTTFLTLSWQIPADFKRRRRHVKGLWKKEKADGSEGSIGGGLVGISDVRVIRYSVL